MTRFRTMEQVEDENKKALAQIAEVLQELRDVDERRTRIQRAQKMHETIDKKLKLRGRKQ